MARKRCQQWWLASVWRMWLIGLLVIGVSCTPELNDPHRELVKHYDRQTPKGDGPFPVIMLVPGCGGFRSSPSRQAHFARIAMQLKKLGYMVVYVDYLAARNLTYCHPQVGLNDIARDILSTIAHLKSRTDVRAESIWVIGWSYGGGGALNALGAMAMENLAPVRGVVAFYPVCVGVRPWPAPVPVLIQAGERDEQTPPETCRELGNPLALRQSIDILVYSEARHGFDVAPVPVGRVTPGRSGRLGAYDQRAAIAAWKALEQFLRRHAP